MRADTFFAEIAPRTALRKVHPAVGSFLAGYLAHEKVVRFGGQHVVNTHFPPYPSPAFDHFIDALGRFGDPAQRLYSVTWAVTNRCTFRCWHCYNAGRSLRDLPLARMREIARELQDLGAIVVTLTGGEPLLRDDLEEIVTAFDDRACLIVGTTGDGLTAERARALKAGGVFAVGISLDSADEAEHDRLRGRPGAFRIALAALHTAEAAGLYPYVVTVGTRELLVRDRFLPFLAFSGQCGAREVHVLEPVAAGRLDGRNEVCLTPAERRLIIDYQKEIAGRADLPILSSFAYLESAEGFGCGAGITHVYLDGAGQLCPCNLVPLSFGDVGREPVAAGLDRMGRHFQEPRIACVGRTLSGRIPPGELPAPPEVSACVCATCLPANHAVPEFFRVREHALRSGAIGAPELTAVYDRVHDDYDAQWVREAGAPVEALVRRLALGPDDSILEAGCGTGFATALLARALGPAGRILAVDLSVGMISHARARIGADPRVLFAQGDALENLRAAGAVDLVFSSWVLGYIPLDPFFAAAARALRPGGRLAFIVHRQDSPREALELFWDLLSREPEALIRQVDFDFPLGAADTTARLKAAGLSPVEVAEGAVTFHHASPEEVLTHLLKSGAGTAFYDAVDPARRPELERRFIERLAARPDSDGGFRTVHDYVVAIAASTGIAAGAA